MVKTENKNHNHKDLLLEVTSGLPVTKTVDQFEEKLWLGDRDEYNQREESFVR